MKKILSTLVLCSLIPLPFAQAQEGAEIQNAIADWMLFDNQGEVLRASETQIRNFLKDGKRTVFYNALGEPLIERNGNSVKTNLSFGADGKTVTSYVQFSIKQGAEGDFVNGATEYEMGPNGQYRVKKQVWQNGYTDYTYNEDGSYSRETVQTNANGNVTSRQNVEYDENGRQIFSSSFQYDANGNVTQRTESSNTYGENGERLTANTTNTNALGQQTWSNYTYTYDEEGKKTGQVWDIKWNYTFTHYRTYSTEYEYDDSGKVTFQEQLVQDKNANGTVGGWWYDNNTYTYDESGKQLSTRRDIVINGGIIKEFWETTRTYDEQGNQASYSSFYTAPNGTVTGSSAEYNREYDLEGRQTSYEQVNKDINGNVTGSYGYQYEYDEQGNQSYYSQQNKDANGNVTSSYAYSYDREYDESGKIISSVQTQLDANGNVLSVSNSQPIYDDEGDYIGEIYSELDADGNVTYSGEYTSTYDEVTGNYESTYLYKDADGNLTSLEKYDNFSWGYVEFTETGEVAYYSGDGELKYTKNNDDGSTKEVTLKSIYTDKDGNGESAVDSSNYNSMVNTFETKEYNTAGNYAGYQMSDVDYDLSGNIDVVTVKNYSGSQGSEVYSGKKEYSGYTYDSLNYTTGYSLTEYNAADEVTTTKVISNIQYDYTGKKTQWNYQILDATGAVIESGVDYAN